MAARKLYSFQVAATYKWVPQLGGKADKDASVHDN
jgi:hypothetical protein